MEAKYIAGLAAGSTDLEGPVGPAHRKITISGNIPPYNVNAHLAGVDECTRVKGAAPQSYLPVNEEGDEEMCRYIAGLAAGSTDLEGPVGPAHRKITISGNIPPYNVNAHLAGVDECTRVKGAAPQSYLPVNEEGDEEMCRCATVGAR